MITEDTPILKKEVKELELISLEARHIFEVLEIPESFKIKEVIYNKKTVFMLVENVNDQTKHKYYTTLKKGLSIGVPIKEFLSRFGIPSEMILSDLKVNLETGCIGVSMYNDMGLMTYA